MNERTDLLMRVEGMTCEGCAEAVRRTVCRLDPEAAVEVDRPGERVAIRTSAQSLASRSRRRSARPATPRPR
ncbi:hypothetical protein BHAOGJBA_2333 [Methylobacterium hispanicum]|uniref:HMA domain-containing protein n=1 Tax=Methylobacterium hispanicum TaxID=270350 RepID=A0AAV4ZKT7_9HYPH|nr:hypothetical protein BHAOGJBA_2333 [Methylobacterium hispanicum]